MQLDIILVTYNSEKWIDACFKSISSSKFNLQDVSLIVVDNNSTDNTLALLNEVQKEHLATYKQFKIIQADSNLGFGRANNLGFENGCADFVFFLNIDTEICANTLQEIAKAIESSSQSVGIWELRQFPYEHPKYYNPVTGETTWSSGAAFVIRREVFHQLGGFDKNIFMYAEDVDLSWRVRQRGYTLKYIPKAVVHHFCYQSANEIKPVQYVNSLINNLLLRYRFGTFGDILRGYALFMLYVKRPEAFKNSRSYLLKGFIKHFALLPKFFQFRRTKGEFKPQFLIWDYELIREGAFYHNELPETNPKVSIIVRTCGRPNVLRETLISLRNQTYRNLEIVIIEDGQNLSENMLRTEFQDLNIVYEATGTKVGRCVVGNLGLKKSTGKYCNFLDDDDVFFADHVEVLVRQLEKHSDYRIAYGVAFETPIIVTSKEPYRYSEMGKEVIYNQPFNKLLLFHHNYLPIQCIMFDRNIFLEEGGFDEGLDYLEDWDLWVRYALKNDFLYVNKTTSMYRVPHDKKVDEERKAKFRITLEHLREKHASYTSQLTVANVVQNLDNVLDQYPIRVSEESFNRFKAKHPVVYKLLAISNRLAGKLLRLVRRIK